MITIFGKENAASVERMEEFVSRHPAGHFMQLPRWARVKRFWDWRGILIEENGAVTAALSVLIRPLPLGFSLLYCPRGPVCDRTDRDVWKELMQALHQIARQHRALLVYLDPDEADSHGEFRKIMGELKFREQSDDGFGNIQPQYVFRLALDGRSETEIFDQFASKTRYNIRLAQRKEVAIREFSGADQIPDPVLESFAALMATTGQRDHFQVRGKEYFAVLLQALGKDGQLLMAYHREEPIAGTIEVFCGKKAWYLYGASSNHHRSLMPNYLLQWTMIRRALERGCTLYDFRGVPGEVAEDHPLYGLYRFKKGFSGTYTKFTGLYIRSFVPLAAEAMQLLIRLRRWWRHRR